MAYRVANRKPTFLWQALLIVLPVVLLAAVGFLSLRQDKLLAQHEATQRAQSIADDLMPKIQADLTPTTEAGLTEITLQVGHDGELMFPPPVRPVPSPQPFDLARLDAGQARLWRACQQVAVEPGGDRRAALKSAIEACRNLIISDPPQPFATVASYSRALWWAELGEFQQAADAFNELLERHPDAVGESGLPLEPLAALKLLEIRNSSAKPLNVKADPGDELRSVFAWVPFSVDAFCASVVGFPTPLSPYLLTAAMGQARTTQDEDDCRKWQALWEQDEAARHLYSAARAIFRRASNRSETNANPAGSEGIGSVSPLVWITLPVARRYFVTNLTSFETNGVPVRSVVELEEQHWLMSRYAGPTQTFAHRFSRAALDRLVRGNGILKPARGRNWISRPVAAGTASSNDPASAIYRCRPEYEVGSNLTARVAAMKSIPDYFGIGIEIAGRRLTHCAPDLRLWDHVGYAGKGGGVRKEFSTQLATNILASAAGPREAGGLKVNVYLTSASALFERQAARNFWFGSLIGVSGLAALAGLGSAWRAFHRQQALNEMKSNFVSSVSHELRAPIASVRLLAESLESGKIQEPARQHEYFRFMVQECRRLSGLIDNVLDFSRIDQGRKQYEFEPTDLPALARQTAAVIEPYAADHGVRLVLNLSEPAAGTPEPQVIVDGKAIQQALINLVDNAIKHSPKGESITIGLEFVGTPAESSGATAHASAAARLWVEDHGEGIAPEEHQKIFDRFYRCGSELRRETPGVGIGLSIVKHIVEAHRGRVVVRSAPGEGSRFTIELPADPTAGSARKRPAAWSVEPPTSPGSTRA